MNSYSISKLKVYYEIAQIPIFIAITFFYITSIPWYILMSGLFFGYFAMTLSQEVGGHRYFSHHAFELNSFWEKTVFVSMCVVANGSPLDWRTHHLEHHQFSDTEKDPTSLYKFGRLGIFTNYWKFKYQPQITGLKTLVWVNNKKPNWILYHTWYFKLVLIYQFIVLMLGIDWFVSFVCIPVILTNFYFNSISAFCHQSRFKTAGEQHLGLNNFYINLLSPGAGQHAEHHNKPGLYRSSNLDIAASIIDKIKS